MKVYRTYKDFSRACDTWNKDHEGLDWEDYKEPILFQDPNGWKAATIGTTIESYESVAIFYSLHEAMRWIEAYDFGDYEYEGTFEEYDNFSEVP